MHDTARYARALFKRHHPLITDPRRVAARFNRDYYGEVNSLLRPVIHDLDVRYRAILIRDPQDILVSAYNKKRGKQGSGDFYDLFAQTLKMLHNTIEDGTPFWYFERYTRDIDYLQALAVACGVTDVVTRPGMLDKVAASPKHIRSFKKMPAAVQYYYDRECRWFEEVYYN